jgi:hypothetical protein
MRRARVHEKGRLIFISGVKIGTYSDLSGDCFRTNIQIEKRMNEEYNRTRHYLSPVTEPKIRNIVETQLITNHAKTIMEVRV